jgi:hypothetical protein
MNSLNKSLATAMLVALAAVTPASASGSSVTALPEMGALATQVASWIATELQVRFANALCGSHATLTAHAPSVTIIDGNHMIVEAKRLLPDAAPLRGLSGPRKKQSR